MRILKERLDSERCTERFCGHTRYQHRRGYCEGVTLSCHCTVFQEPLDSESEKVRITLADLHPKFDD